MLSCLISKYKIPHLGKAAAKVATGATATTTVGERERERERER